MIITLRSLFPHPATLIRRNLRAAVAIGALAVGLSAGEAPGIAQAFDRDAGLAAHAQVLFFDDFESGTSVLAPTGSGRTIVALASPTGGTRVMASHNLAGTNAPYDRYAPIAGSDTVYYRFYSRFEPGYDMGGGVKGPGVNAKKSAGAPGGDAGIKPQGDDKFSARVSFDDRGRPYLYYYHMDMGQWGSHATQNIGTPVSMQPGEWYCLEMMLKANTPGVADGVLRLWIDGVLKIDQGSIRFRTTTDLKMNWINHSAYFGGDWTSPKDQSRFEDNMVAARSYIGPLGTGTGSTTAPAAPTNLTATVMSTSRIDVSWTDASTNETGFIIERKTGSGGTWSTLTTRAANSTGYSNTGLSADTTYVYRVRATNAVGNSAASNEVSAKTHAETIPPTAPAAPTNLSATAISASRIDLSWSDASTDETGFIVERKTGSSGTWSAVITRGANSTTFSNTALTADTIYVYRVRAANAAGQSAPSNESSAQTKAATADDSDADDSHSDSPSSKSCGFGSALALLVLAIGSAGLRRRSGSARMTAVE